MSNELQISRDALKSLGRTMTKAIVLALLCGAFALLTDCTSTPRTEPLQGAPVSVPAVIAPAVIAPTSAWITRAVQVNPIDGVRTQFIVNTGDSTRDEKLVLSFENGHLSTKHVGIVLQTRSIVASIDYGDNEYHARVRIKFDDEQPKTQDWVICDGKDALTPRGNKQFLEQLLKHNRLVVEFSNLDESEHTVTFDLAGLNDTLKAAGVK